MDYNTGLKELFSFILNNYRDNFRFGKTDPNYKVLCYDIPLMIKNTAFPLKDDIILTGSCGKGQKTDYPWVAIFNSNITRTATRGLYIVYLFRSDMSGFYLTLNQGITYFENQYKKEKYVSAVKVADYFKNEIGDTYFSKDPIDLRDGKGKLGYGYEKTTILSKFYSKDSFTEEELFKDLEKMMVIYNEIVGVLGEDNYDYDKAIDKLLLDRNNAFTNAVDAIDEIKKKITSSIDVDVVRKLSYCEPKSKSIKKYSELRNRQAIKKIDYIDRAKADAEIGQLGEELALEYEIDRLNNLGRSDLAEKVRRVSIISDAYGYDIESYDLVGLSYKKVYIEVKTTVNKSDVDFQVSKNEVATSNEKDKSYCIFRIYDAKNVNPKFYKVYGKIEDHFELNPITYMARYK